MTRQLLSGLTRFKKDYFPRYEEHYRRLVTEGQTPRTLFIGCSDSRVVPEILTDSEPGSLFTIRNVGNLVPPFESDRSHHGVSSAIDYAVEILEVQDVVVCGHTHCGAVRALYRPPPQVSENLSRWLGLAAPARVDGEFSEELLRRTERRSIVLQLDRLLGFPTVRVRVESGRVALHGWHYLLEEGTVHILDLESGEFVPHD